MKIDNLQVDEETEQGLRDELHRKWLEQQDMAATDEILSKISHGWGRKKQALAAALLEDDDDLEDALEIGDATEDCEEQHADRDQPAEDVTGAAADAGLSREDVIEDECQEDDDADEKENEGQDNDDEDDKEEDDNWKERILRRRKLEELEKLEEFTPPEMDESSQEIMVLFNKASTAQAPKSKPSVGGHMSLFGLGLNSRSISRQSSFMSMKANSSFGGGGLRTTGSAQSYVFSRDDSNSRDRTLQKDSQEDLQNSDPNVQGNKLGVAATGVQHPKRDVRGCTDPKAGAKRKAQPSGGLSLFGLLKRQTSMHSLDNSAASSVIDEGISLFAAVKSIKPLRQGREGV